jgi:lysophospholipase L1-like esterase
MLRLTILWTLCLFLAPLLVLQGLLVRARTVALPAARGPSNGQVGEGSSSLLLLGIGDSVIEGLGVANVEEALTRQLALKLHQQNSRPILWQTQGRNGDRVRDLIARLPLLDGVEPDLVLVSIGVNDVSHLTSVTRWQWEVTHLIAELKLRFSAPIVFLGIPPMGQFSALPQPLRFALGVRARLLDQTLQQAAKLLSGIYWFDTASGFQAQLLARDGYHPGPLACESLATALSLQFGELLNSPVQGSTQGAPPVNWGVK